MAQTFAGQKIIVIGGTSGIGKAVPNQFSELVVQRC